MRDIVFILTILAAITALEYIFVYVNVGHGIILALFLTLAIYVTVSVPEKENLTTRAAESLALIPLYVLFTSSLPWFFINQTYLLPAVYSIILALCAWHIYEKNIGAERLGLVKRRFVLYVLAGALVGIFTGTTEYLILKPAAALPSLEMVYLLRDLVYMTFFVGLGEELLFRGIIQTDLQDMLGRQKGLFLAAYLFGIMHLTWRSVPELFFAFLSGYLLGYIFNRTGSLVMPISLHGVNNTVLVGVLPYLMG
jgi:hypothetical protein